MNTIANKLICLNLNANWQPIGFKTVKDAIVDLCGGEADGGEPAVGAEAGSGGGGSSADHENL